MKSRAGRRPAPSDQLDSLLMVHLQLVSWNKPCRQQLQKPQSSQDANRWITDLQDVGRLLRILMTPMMYFKYHSSNRSESSKSYVLGESVRLSYTETVGNESQNTTLFVFELPALWHKSVTKSAYVTRLNQPAPSGAPSLKRFDKRIRLIPCHETGIWNTEYCWFDLVSWLEFPRWTYSVDIEPKDLNI